MATYRFQLFFSLSLSTLIVFLVLVCAIRDFLLVKRQEENEILIFHVHDMLTVYDKICKYIFLLSSFSWGLHHHHQVLFPTLKGNRAFKGLA